MRSAPALGAPPPPRHARRSQIHLSHRSGGNAVPHTRPLDADGDRGGEEVLASGGGAERRRRGEQTPGTRRRGGRPACLPGQHRRGRARGTSAGLARHALGRRHRLRRRIPLRPRQPHGLDDHAARDRRAPARRRRRTTSWTGTRPCGTSRRVSSSGSCSARTGSWIMPRTIVTRRCPGISFPRSAGRLHATTPRCARSERTCTYWRGWRVARTSPWESAISRWARARGRRRRLKPRDSRGRTARRGADTPRECGRAPRPSTRARRPAGASTDTAASASSSDSIACAAWGCAAAGADEIEDHVVGIESRHPVGQHVGELRVRQHEQRRSGRSDAFDRCEGSAHPFELWPPSRDTPWHAGGPTPPTDGRPARCPSRPAADSTGGSNGPVASAAARKRAGGVPASRHAYPSRSARTGSTPGRIIMVCGKSAAG